jgi:Tol biopolymer transport system component
LPPTLTATAAPPTATPPPPIATTKLITNVRAGPSAFFPVIGKLKKGERRPILGKSEDGKWWRIDLDGKAGWIPGDFTDVEGGTNFVAVIPVAPPPTNTPIPTRVVYGVTPPPKPTPTATPLAPSGRVYFVIQDHAAWLKPNAKDEIFSDVILGAPGDLNLYLSTNASPLDWSETAGKLAYVFNSGSQDKLQTVDGSSNVVTLASHGAISSPRWFGDGTQIAFIGYDNNFQNESIYVLNAKDGRVVQACPAHSGEQLRGLAVNPKTGDLAFVSNYSGRFELWKMDRLCNAPKQMTNDNADVTGPSFSPDGTRLAYVSTKTSPTDHHIYIMPANGGSAVSLGLTESFAPSFSPDGAWLTFAHNFEVYIMDTNGGNIETLTPGDRPRWAP